MSYSTGKVTGNMASGGLVGGNSAGTITNCYSSASVAGAIRVGGLVGESIGYCDPACFPEDCCFPSHVSHCYSTGSVTGEAEIGGFVGVSPHTLVACFWDIETSGQTTSAGGVGKTTDEMQTATTFLEAGWDFMGEIENGPNDIWWILEGRDYPKLWWEYPKEHVFEVEIALGTDYEDPDDPNDTVYEFELTIVTDGSVQRLEFITPSGSVHEIPNLPQHEVPVPGGWLETAWEYDGEAGVYEWSYEMKLDDPNGLADYGDGSYEIVTYYDNGSQEQTTVWFGIPGTDEPIPQPLQEPVLISLADGDIVAPPVALEWNAPTDPAMNRVLVSLARQDAPEWLDFEFERDATGIDELLMLDEGPWAVDLVFAARYSYKNADSVRIQCIKYTESGYTFTVAP